MKTAFLLSTLLVGAQSFAPVARPAASSALAAALPEEQLSESQKEIKGIQEKWNEVRHLSREEATAQLEGEWLEAHGRFYDQYDDDMERMIEIVTKLEKQIEQPRIQKKTKGQRRRDAFARKSA
mmetsp:Transcript_7992/g.17194  ORF Transcript_7992/g.17194 Transcript_7992/m.17194 type:complete len:124 (-) Transcript_7992:132-503(-)|eukprot:CAMPEP_0168181652 /NCGR_PEP_ID=MMETSP0139_2-20121125/11378_1 /TAXON_ID=44445 /ORGANISM="Pseudo-nitzschia australis, Strain 10249 10 AB" /LENGTH=123 /DNA_ID=CAMNT_0008102337 /DNA_START=95 /DNA_END=466 /DNA_ORIENTATION=+